MSPSMPLLAFVLTTNGGDQNLLLTCYAPSPSTRLHVASNTTDAPSSSTTHTDTSLPSACTQPKLKQQWLMQARAAAVPPALLAARGGCAGSNQQNRQLLPPMPCQSWNLLPQLWQHL